MRSPSSSVEHSSLGGLTAGISNQIGNMTSMLSRAISHGIVSGVRAIVQGQANFKNWLEHNADSPHYIQVLQMQAEYMSEMNYIITYYAIHGTIPIRRKDGSWKY